MKDLICNPQKDLGVYKDIIRTYIKDFIEVNQFIESMPMSELEAFVYSIKEIFEKGEYSVPDIHSKNIILTDERLMLIDNHMSRKSDDKYLASVDVERFVATRLIIMFKSNRVLGGVKKSAKHLAMYPEIEDLVKLNRELCSAAMEKLFVAMNNVLGKSYNWENVYGILNKNTSLIVGDENAKNILSVLE